MDFPFHPRSGVRHQFRPIVHHGSPLAQRFYPILYGSNWGSYRPRQPPQYQRYPPGQIGRFQNCFQARIHRGEDASHSSHPVHKTERILRTSVDDKIDSTKFLSPSKVQSETNSSNTSKGKPKKEATNRDKNQSKKVVASVAGTSKGESSMEKENRNNVTSNPQATPQYRIFKRGDLAGLSSPLELITGMNIQQSDGGSSCNFVKAEQSDEPTNGIGGSSIQTEKSQDSASEAKAGSNRTATSLVTDIARFHSLNPEYRLIKEEGPPHAPTFTIVLTLGEEQYEATGPSIKKAQLAAATKAVELTKLLRPPPRGQPRKNNFRSLKPIGSGPNSKRLNWSVNQLNAFAAELNQKVVFSTQSPNYANGVSGGISIVRVQVGEKCFIGEGKNVQAAKNSAIQQALNALIALKQEIELAKMLESNGSNATELLDSSIKSPISIVHEMSLKRGKKVSFEVISEEGPPHMKMYAIKCIVGEIETQGSGPTKQAAKKASCEEMIEKLKEVPMKQPKISSLKLMQNGLCTKPKVVRKKPAAPVIKEVDKQVVSPISRLLHIAHVRKYKEPEFIVIKQADDVPPEVNPQKPEKRAKKKKPFFTMQVTVGPYTCEGSGPNKKAAKKAAADNALIALGYAPSAPAKEHQSSVPTTTTDSSGSGTSAQPVKDKKQKNLKITSARQIVPGVLMIKSEDADEPQVASAIPTSDTPVASHVNSGIIKSSTPVASAVAPMEGIRKLDYLVQLLDLAVSYTNFPKKEGFLSVAILSSNPPRMAHGIGPTVEAAQNAAAMDILAELATTGLDSVNTGLSNGNDVKPTIQS